MRGGRVLGDIRITVKAVKALLLSNALVQFEASFYALTALTVVGMSLRTLLPRINHM